MVEVSGNNNLSDDLEEDASAGPSEAIDFHTGGSSLQSGNIIIEVAEDEAENMVNKSISKTINAEANARRRRDNTAKAKLIKYGSYHCNPPRRRGKC